MRITVALIAAGLATAPALAQTMNSPAATSPQAQSNSNSGTMAVSARTKSFVQNAGIGNLFEIQAGQLALQKSQRDDVKQGAQQLVNDHTKAGDNMKQALSPNDPQSPQQLDSKHSLLLLRLQNASPARFDRTYIRQQLQAHRDAIALFRIYAQSGDNPQLKQFAQTTLPVLEQHLIMVQQLQQGSNAVASTQSKSNAGGGSSATTKKTSH